MIYIALSVAIFAGLAASNQEVLTKILLKPAGDQQFIFTTPGGGFDFAFQLCIATGLLASIPVIVYQLLRYLSPLASNTTVGFLARVGIWSCVLAVIGVCFGYFIALPSGLNFLLHGFAKNQQIEALINIQSYFSFVLAYLIGSGLLFQLPLVLITINKIQRLSAKRLMAKQRWVILLSFIIGAMISPTPDVRNQAILSLPIILMYNLAVAMIWIVNRRLDRPARVKKLREQDAASREQRLSDFSIAQMNWNDELDTEELEQSNNQYVASIASSPPKPKAAVNATLKLSARRTTTQKTSTSFGDSGTERLLDLSKVQQPTNMSPSPQRQANNSPIAAQFVQEVAPVGQRLNPVSSTPIRKVSSENSTRRPSKYIREYERRRFRSFTAEIDY